MKNKIFSLFFYLVSTLLLGACSSLAKDDSTLKNDADIVFATQAFSLSGENALPDKWWLALNDPTLNQLIERALKNNNDLKTSLLKIKNTHLNWQTVSADQALNIDGTSGYSTNSGKSFGLVPKTDKYSVGLAASYEWDLWNRLGSQLENADLDIKISKLDYKTQMISISTDIAIAWYRLVEQVQQLALLKLQLKVSEDYQHLTEQQFRSGQALAADVLQQRQTVESVKGDRFNTQRLIWQYKYQLALLLSEPSFNYPVDEHLQLPNLPPLPSTGLKTALIHHRPDVQATFNQLAQADKKITIAIANRFPKISFSANYELNGKTFDTIFDNWFANFASNLVVPVLDADRRKTEVAKSENLYQQGLSNYRQKVLIAVKEVEDALVNEKQQTQYIQSLKQQLALSSSANNQIRTSYINGAMDFLRVLNAVLSDQNLQRNYITANRQLIEYRISLYRALSGGWEIENND